MSRLTFRDKTPDVCWQKQLRDQHLVEGVPPVPHLDLKRAEVRRVSRHLAQQIIYKYEWLGTMAQTGYHYGVFFGSYCAGVCCVAAGAATGGVNTHLAFSVKREHLCALARGACVHWAPVGSNSKLVAWTCKLLAKDTGAKIVIAYSDTDAGEVGTIYQACNWAYIGVGDSTTQFVAPNGRIYDQKIIYDTRRRNGTLKTVAWTQQRDAFLSAGWHEQLSNPKHRYVYILDRSDKALIDRVERMRQPYPKRATSADSGTPGDQPGGSGATPTVALNAKERA